MMTGPTRHGAHDDWANTTVLPLEFMHCKTALGKQGGHYGHSSGSCSCSTSLRHVKTTHASFASRSPEDASRSSEERLGTPPGYAAGLHR